MANGQELRLRMRAIQQTLQVTKAMDLISTAKLRKARRILEDTEPFFMRIQKSLYDIVVGAGMIPNEFIKRIEKNTAFHSAVLIISSDKGMAGGYNANIFKTVNTLCAQLRNPVLLPVGNSAYRYFSHAPYPLVENFSFNSQLPTLDDAQLITHYLIMQYLWGMFDEIYIVYTHLYSTVKLVPTIHHLLPLDAQKIQAEIIESGGQQRTALSFEYLPSAETVFEALVPLYLKGMIYGCLVEAYASEQSARMKAMNESSKNAEKMLADLQIYYNRIRQATITQEMTEIISGSLGL
ncbi:MAG: ATP synthase F1 subunit gamma [Spirochaetaceae bacterium]|nr:ATP synthase F1 subunit gamma [Spirochaetaceae bacterium]